MTAPPGGTIPGTIPGAPIIIAFNPSPPALQPQYTGVAIDAGFLLYGFTAAVRKDIYLALLPRCRIADHF
jgi:hypothetical protein